MKRIKNINDMENNEKNLWELCEINFFELGDCTNHGVTSASSESECVRDGLVHVFRSQSAFDEFIGGVANPEHWVESSLVENHDTCFGKPHFTLRPTTQWVANHAEGCVGPMSGGNTVTINGETVKILDRYETREMYNAMSI